MANGSWFDSSVAGFKPLAQDAGRRAVAEALGRRGIEGRVDLGPKPRALIPRYAIAGSPLVDVVVVARTHGADATDFIAELERVSTYTDRWITRVIAGNNTPAAINAAVRALRGDHVVLLDASTRVITPTWLETMLEVSQRAGIGAVGMRLRYPDGTVAHEGMVCGRLGLAASVDQHLHVIKEMRAVSGACLMRGAMCSMQPAASTRRSRTRSGMWITACACRPSDIECSAPRSPR